MRIPFWMIVALATAVPAHSGAQSLGDLFNKGVDLLEKNLGEGQATEPGEGQKAPAPSPQSAKPQSEPAPQASDPKPQEQRSAQTRRIELTFETQDRLNRLGYDAGPVDGMMGPRTRSAVEAFQRDHGLPVTGRVTEALVTSLQRAERGEPVIATVEAPAGLPESDEPAASASSEPIDSADATAAAAPATVFAEAPAKAGLRAVGPVTRNGRLLSGYPITRGDVRGETVPFVYRDRFASHIDLALYVDLLLLGEWPDLLEDEEVALAYARRFLTGARLEQYVDPCRGGCNMQVPYAGWAGGNEFEREASYLAFMADYHDRLVEAAPAFPVANMHVAEVEILPYDDARDAFPIRPRRPVDMFFGAVNPTSNLGWEVAGEIPTEVAVPREEAPGFLERITHPGRIAYLAVERRLGEPQWDHAVNRPTLKLRVEGVRLYANADTQDLLRDFGTLGGDEAEPAPKPAPAPQTVEGRVSPFVLAMKLAPEAIDEDLLTLMVRRQIEREQVQLQIGEEREPGLDFFRADEIEGRVPQFAAQELRDVFLERVRQRLERVSQNLSFAVEQRLGALKYDTGRISTHSNTGTDLGYLMTMRTLVERQKLELPPLGARQVSNVPVLEGTVPAEGLPGSVTAQDLRPQPYLALDRRIEVPPLEIDRATAETFWQRPSCETNRLTLMQQGMSEDEARDAVQECYDRLRAYGSRPVFRLEVDIEVEDVAFFEQVSVIKARVTRATLRDPHGRRVRTLAPDDFPPAHDTWAQVEQAAQQEEAKPVPNLRVNEPAPGLPLNAEVMDLLQVRYLPDTVDATMWRRMLEARLALEQAATARDTPPAWGRFFPEGTQALSDEHTAALLPAFKEWTRTRARHMPSTLTVRRPLQELAGPMARQFTSPCRRAEDAGADSREAVIAGRMCEVISAATELPDPMLYLVPRPSRHGTGPRADCLGAGLSGAYCRARKYASAPLDLLMLDRVPGVGRRDRPAGGNVIVEIDVKPMGMVELESWPETRLHRAVAAVDSLAKEHGVQTIGLQEPATPEGPVYRVALRAEAARVIDRSNGDVLSKPDLTEPPPLPLERLKLAASQSAGLDILGIRLGDKWADAETKVLEHMAVGEVINADRGKSMATIQGRLDPYTSGRLYISESGREMIALLNEPPAHPDTVVGVWRALILPRGTIEPVQLNAQLTDRYGEPTRLYEKDGFKVQGFGAIWSDLPPANDCSELSRRHWRDMPWLNADGTSWRPEGALSMGVPSLGNEYLFRNIDKPGGRAALCGPQLGVEFLRVEGQRANDAGADEIITWLHDQRGYADQLSNSRAWAADAPAGSGREAKSPELKF